MREYKTTITNLGFPADPSISIYCKIHIFRLTCSTYFSPLKNNIDILKKIYIYVRLWVCFWNCETSLIETWDR